MFNNIGKKLQVLAIVSFILGVIVSVISGLIYCIMGSTMVGILVIIFGSLGSWIGSWSIYALGLVAENSENQLADLILIKTKLRSLELKSAAPVPIKSVTKNTTLPKASSKQEGIPKGQVRCPDCSETFSATESRCPYCGYKR